MSTVPASIRRAGERDTLALPFRIPLKEFFGLKEAGAVMGLSESMVEKLYDQGHITGHSHNAGAGHRKHKRVLRVALVAYAIRTADYTDDSLTQALEACLPHLPTVVLLAIAARCRDLVAQNVASNFEPRRADGEKENDASAQRTGPRRGSSLS